MSGRISPSIANMDNRNNAVRSKTKSTTAKKPRKKQGYTDRKDESVAARLGAGPASKRKARRDESYGSYGSTAAKPRGGGRINV
tara:strand:- start:203 stop:454 length:252 start_codon:yes stop_codon:yes gene_type:complete